VCTNRYYLYIIRYFGGHYNKLKMVELKYIGTHQPQGMVIEVEEADVKTLLDNGEYELLFKLPTLKKEVVVNDIRKSIN